MKFPIPDGWRLLEVGEVTQSGDMIGNFGTNESSNDWTLVSLLGTKVSKYDIDGYPQSGECYPFIRRIEGHVAPEKEWVNPWD